MTVAFCGAEIGDNSMPASLLWLMRSLCCSSCLLYFPQFIVASLHCIYSMTYRLRMCLHGNLEATQINKSGLKIFNSCPGSCLGSCLLEEHALEHTWRFLLELVGLFERLLETEMAPELRNEAVSLVQVEWFVRDSGDKGRVHRQIGFKRKSPQGISRHCFSPWVLWLLRL